MKRILHRMLILFTAAVFIAACSVPHTAEEAQPAAGLGSQEITKMEIAGKKEQIVRLILDGEYDQAVRSFNELYQTDDPLYVEFTKNNRSIKNYAELLQMIEEGRLDEAKQLLDKPERFKDLPVELQTHYQKTLTDFNETYAVFRAEAEEQYIKDFHTRTENIISLLAEQKYDEAFDLVLDQYHTHLNGQFWYETGLFDEETEQLFLALHDYASAMHSYLHEEYVLAYTDMDKRDPARLPASLQAQFIIDQETVMKAYQKHLSETAAQNSGYAGSLQKEDQGCRNDEFDVCDYADPYEFWYWHPDDFYDFEDAEEYWHEHHKK